MNITFHGAAHQVTGSCHLVESSNKKILFDCGMFQGGDFNEGKNNDAFPFDVQTIDAVLVSHAHADHTGRIPKLIRDGYKGSIYMTKGTKELSRIIWEDSVRIMAYNNKKFQAPILFTQDDVDRAYARCKAVDYHEVVDLGDGDSAIFKDAGHIFGSSFIELTVEGKTIAYSGDLGNKNVPILKPTEQLSEIDVLLIESTYGDRIHETETDRRSILRDTIKEGYQRGGTIMMPAFSIERTQEILYDLDQLKEHEGALPDFKIYLDSPMAIRALDVYEQYPEYYDEKACEQYKKGDNFLDFPGLITTLEREESKKINSAPDPKMVIAGAGMMNGGRILHHAKRHLQDPNATLVFVGYQAQGTLGRRLYEGAEKVTIHDQEVTVNAHITAIGALSAHADQNKLVEWVQGAKKMPEKVYCVHGEPHAATALAHRLRDDLGVKAFVPDMDERVDI